MSPILKPIAFATGLFLSSMAQAQEPAFLDPDWAEPLFHVNGMMEHSIEVDEAIGIETLIIQNGETLLHRAYGVEDVDTEEPLEPGAIWSVKSMTKPMVALAILMLVDDGDLELYEPISTWLPEFAGDQRVTVSDLLSHKSGVTGLGNNGRDQDTFRGWVEAWADEPPAGPMGQYRYSDFNFMVATLIIAERSGMSAEDFIQTRILDPLGMTDSYMTYDPEADWAPRVSSRYVKRTSGFEEVWDQTEPIWYPYFPGAWGLWTSAKDYAAFMQFWLDGGEVDGESLIDPALLDLALTPHTRQIDGSWAYGLGWYLHGSDEARRGPAAFSHGGYDGTRAYAYPEAGTIALILTHSRGSMMLSQAESELIMADGLGARSPSIALLDDLEWVLLEPDEVSAVWVGTYDGTANMREGGAPVSMSIEEDGEHFRWTANIETLGGTELRSGLFMAESETRGWLVRENDEGPQYVMLDRRFELSASGQLTLYRGEERLAQTSRVVLD